MKKITLLSLVSSFALAGGLSAATVQYNLDFGNNSLDPALVDGSGNPFQKLKPGGFNTSATQLWNIGDGLTLAFTDPINNYALNFPNNRLVEDGLFTPENGSANFTISGLTPGSTVSLYAISSWNGTGRAGWVSFGGGSLVDTGSASNTDGQSVPEPLPGNQVLISEMAPINLDVLVSGSGQLSGTVASNGRPEGQIGGFIVQVTAAVPEPTSAILGLAGGMGLLLGRRRRK
jgi:hypothetical protein